MHRLAASLARFFLRWMPESFVVAILLTTLTFVLAVTVSGYPVAGTAQAWYGGFWDLLTFTNQIVLTLLLGYALAHTPPVQRLLLAAGALVRSARMAYVVACLVTAAASLVSWGLGLIVGGLAARAIAASCNERGIPIHYPLLVAAALSGYVVWHQGLSSSIGLVIATPGHFLETRIGLVPAEQTLFSVWNVLVVAAVLLTLPWVMAALRPVDTRQCEAPPPSVLAKQHDTGAAQSRPPVYTHPAEWLENSRWPNLLIAAAGLYVVVSGFVSGSMRLELNSLNFMFLIAGLLLSRSPVQYVRLIVDGGRVAAPFLLQYPFYAGIAGVIRDSGLGVATVEMFVSLAGPTTLPLIGFLSGGLLNLFIPSGGGQWAVQGPIMMEAALALNADIARTAMAVALGDQWTNLIHPLILIPFVAVAGLHIRQIMGFCMFALAWTGVIFLLALIVS